MDTQHIFEFGVFKIPYILRRTEKSKRISIVAEHKDGIVVKIPEGLEERRAHDFVKDQASWIFKHWHRAERLKRIHKDQLMPIAERPEISYLGRTYRLRVVTGSDLMPSVHFNGEMLVITCFDAKESERLLERWYRQQAKAVIVGALLTYSPLMDVKYDDVVIKDQKSRWGSCSSQGNLNFNWRLIKAPKDVLEYVVIHELAHRKEMNHSERFWKIVSQYSKNYVQHNKWLKANSLLLMS